MTFAFNISVSRRLNTKKHIATRHAVPGPGTRVPETGTPVDGTHASSNFKVPNPATSLSRCLRQSVLSSTVRSRLLRSEKLGRKKNTVVDLLKSICTANTLDQERLRSTSLRYGTIQRHARRKSLNARPRLWSILKKPAAKQKGAEQVSPFFPCLFGFLRLCVQFFLHVCFSEGGDRKRHRKIQSYSDECEGRQDVPHPLAHRRDLYLFYSIKWIGYRLFL